MCWKAITDWAVAGGTLVLAAVAVFQETIRSWFYRPQFKVTTSTEPPHCVSVPVTDNVGTFLGDRVYLRVWVENTGNAAAKNVEVYASELRYLRADHKWERIKSFPSMNLKWADIGFLFWPLIAPKVGKHCDVVHITDPAKRLRLGEDAPRLLLDPKTSNMVFDLITAPNHKSHIVGPGEYQLDIIVSAENALPHRATLQIALDGRWDVNETIMLRDHAGIRLV